MPLPSVTRQSLHKVRSGDAALVPVMPRSADLPPQDQFRITSRRVGRIPVARFVHILVQRAGMVTIAPGTTSVLARAKRIWRTVKATLLSKSSSAIQNQV